MTNLVFHLGLPVNAVQLEQMIVQVEQLNDENNMTLDVFGSWFKENVIAATNAPHTVRGVG